MLINAPSWPRLVAPLAELLTPTAAARHVAQLPMILLSVLFFFILVVAAAVVYATNCILMTMQR